MCRRPGVVLVNAGPVVGAVVERPGRAGWNGFAPPVCRDPRPPTSAIDAGGRPGGPR